jgi:hypothetical protein
MNLLPRNGRCLQSHYVGTGLHATILDGGLVNSWAPAGSGGRGKTGISPD